MGPSSSAAVSAWSRLLTPHALDISRVIAPQDAMFGGNLEHYMGVGHSALRCIGAAALLGGVAPPSRILDLPCGHGRVMRSLRAAFPEAELTGCDLDAAGVDYCRTAFRAVGLVSRADPAALRLPGTYDLLWCGSLLTHLPATGWREFLKLFERALAPGGLLVFTTHGRRTQRWLRQGHADNGMSMLQMYGLDTVLCRSLRAEAERTGFGYVDYPGQKGYGISLSSLSWVWTQLQTWTTLRLVTASEHAWDDHHDVVACVKPP